MPKKTIQSDMKRKVLGVISEEKAEAIVNEMVVGELIPIKEVPVRGEGGRGLDHWLALCKTIPPGFAQEIKGYSHSGARNAIKRLIELKALPDEFIVRARGKGKKNPRIFIVHLKAK